MRNRHRGWRRQAVRVAALDERDRLIAAEPAGVFQLHAVDFKATAFRFGKAADHQRGRERPWLRGEILDSPADDSGLFVDFPPDSSLDSFPRLNETGQRRKHAL